MDRVRALVVGVLAMRGAVAWAQECPPPYYNPSDTTCQEDGETVSTGTGPCCEGLAPVRESGCRCRPIGDTTTTVLTETTTTVTEPTTTTTRPPDALFPVVRYVPADVMLGYFHSSQGILWDPRTGLYADQYQRSRRVEEFLIVESAAMRAFRDISKCQGNLEWASGLMTVNFKFFVRYNFRNPGQPYGWHPNYIEDNYAAILKKLRACALPSELSPILQDAIRTDWPQLAHSEPIPENETIGIYDPQRHMEPLTPAQCAALTLVDTVHREQTDAVLARDMGLALELGPMIAAAHVRFTSLARDPWEANMMDLTFPGFIDIVPDDPFCTQQRADVLTAETDLAHHNWSLGFHCDTGRAPEQDVIAHWKWRHMGAHFRRAACIQGMELVDPVFDPVVEPEMAAAFPKCVDGPNYDTHGCPDTE